MSLRKYRNLFVPTIRSKIKHIIDTATRSNDTLNLGGNSHFARCRLEWKHFKEHFHGKDVKDIEPFFPNGLVVVLRNNDYFDLHEKKERCELEESVLTRLGSDALVSSVIHIESFQSSSTDVLPLVKKLKDIPELFPLKVKDSSGKMTHTSTKTRTSNSFWEGHYAIHIKGGSSKTHTEGNIKLANPIYDYASKFVQDSVELQIVYMMLCSKNSEILLEDSSKITEVKSFFLEECKKRNLLEFERFGRSNPIDKDGFLVCCISSVPIDASDFLIETESDESIQYCHIIPKSCSDITIVDSEVLTTFRPYNIGWGKKWVNRFQGDSSIEVMLERARLLLKHQSL